MRSISYINGFMQFFPFLEHFKKPFHVKSFNNIKEIINRFCLKKKILHLLCWCYFICVDVDVTSSVFVDVDVTLFVWWIQFTKKFLWINAFNSWWWNNWVLLNSWNKIKIYENYSQERWIGIRITSLWREFNVSSW